MARKNKDGLEPGQPVTFEQIVAANAARLEKAKAASEKVVTKSDEGKKETPSPSWKK